ncbi:unnamed protein product [Schistosoma mattheei]|uniref:Uncharacterized protein n=1 Tax=Schistosoma mattheei TaxID=31246 RepID=A0A183NNH3_9TREM|nr:unnamed protein product [Schistosoma mattheei]
MAKSEIKYAYLFSLKQASVNTVDEPRESHKSSTRKRSTPTTIPGSAPITPETAMQNLRYTNAGIVSNTVPSVNSCSGGSSGTGSRPTTSPGENIYPVNSSLRHHHHHQSRQSSHQRASSGNSTESREPSLENERNLIASSSAGLVKKAKKGKRN